MLLGARLGMSGDSIREAEHYGIELVGGCQLNGSMLSSFYANKYGRIPYEFVRDANYQEYVIELNLGSRISTSTGFFSYIGGFDGFTPFYQEGTVSYSSYVCWASSNGSAWDVFSKRLNGIAINWGGVQRLKSVYDNGVYSFYEWIDGEWVMRSSLSGALSATKSGLYWQFGTNRGTSNPFGGSVNLDHCYIVNGDKLWWEFQKGSYERANGLL